MKEIDHEISSVADENMSDLPVGEQTRKERIFLGKFDWIQRQTILGVTQKAIVAALQDRFDLKLSPVRFNALYEAEKARRAKEGGHPRCPCCGAILSSDTEDQIGDASSMGEVTTNAAYDDSKRVNS